MKGLMDFFYFFFFSNQIPATRPAFFIDRQKLHELISNFCICELLDIVVH